MSCLEMSRENYEEKVIEWRRKENYYIELWWCWNQPKFISLFLLSPLPSVISFFLLKSEGRWGKGNNAVINHYHCNSLSISCYPLLSFSPRKLSLFRCLTIPCFLFLFSLLFHHSMKINSFFWCLLPRDGLSFPLSPYPVYFLTSFFLVTFLPFNPAYFLLSLLYLYSSSSSSSFIQASPRNVTAQIGHPVYLHCIVEPIGDKMVRTKKKKF